MKGHRGGAPGMMVGDGVALYKACVALDEDRARTMLAKIDGECRLLGPDGTQLGPVLSPLSVASMRGEVDAMRMLLRLGASPGLRAPCGTTALRLACLDDAKKGC